MIPTVNYTAVLMIPAGFQALAILKFLRTMTLCSYASGIQCRLIYTFPRV